MANKKILKNLLTTASALAVIVGGAQSAGAQTQTSQKNPSALANNGDWDNAPFATGDDIAIGNNAHVITFNQPDFTIKQIDNNGKAAVAMNITENVNIGNILANGGAARDYTFGVAKTLRLIGGSTVNRNAASVYDGLADINFGGAIASVLEINTKFTDGAVAAGNGQAITLTGDAINQGAGNILNVKTNLEVNKVTWGTLETANISNDATYHINVGNVALPLTGTVNLLGADSNFKVSLANAANKAVTFTNSIGSAAGADNAGIIEINSAAHASTVSVTTAAGVKTLGTDATHRLKELKLAAGAGSETSFGANINVFAKKITHTGTGKVTFTSAVDSGVDSSYVFGAAGKASFVENAAITTMDFANNDGTIEIATAKNLTTTAVQGNAGAAAIIGTIDLLGDNTFTGTATGIKIIKAGANGKTAVIGAGNHTVDQVVGAHAAGFINFADGANIKAVAGNAGSGAINRTAGLATTLKFLGSSEVDGAVGTNAANAIFISGGAGKTVVFAKDVIGDVTFDTTDGAIGQFGAALTGGVAFTTDGTLKFAGDADHTLTGAVSMGAGDAAGKGSIIVDGGVTAARTITIDGAIGNAGVAGEATKIIDAGGAKLKLTGGNVHTRMLKTGGTEVELNQANGVYKIDALNLTTNTTALKITQNVTLKGADAGTSFGAAVGNKLTSLAFVGDRTLIIGDKVSIYASLLKTGNNNEGVIEFAGDGILDAAIGATTLKSIKAAGGAGKVAKIVAPISTNGAIEIGAGTLSFGGNVTAADIKASGAGAGTLKFENTIAATVTGTVDIGGVNSLGTIEFAGADVTFANTITHAADKTLKFSGAAQAKVTLDKATDIADNPIINESADGITHTIVIGKDMDFNKAVGTAKKQIIILGDANKYITVKNVGTEGMIAQTNTVDQTEVSLEFAGAKLAAVGTKEKRVRLLAFDENGSISGDVFAKDTEVALGKVATFGGKVTGDSVKLAGLASKAIFAEGSSVDAAIAATVPGKGDVDFTGNASLTKTVGSATNALENVKFLGGADKIVNLNNSAYATNIELGAAKFNVGTPVTLGGGVKAVSSNIALGANTLTFANGVALSGDVKVSSNISLNGTNLSGGTINVASGALNNTGLNSVAIALDDASVKLPAVNTSRTFQILKNDGTLTTALDASKISIAKTNTLSKWTSAVDGKGNIILTQINDAVAQLTKALGAKADADDLEKIRLIVGAKEGSDGEAVLNILAKLPVAEQDELLSRLSSVSSVVGQVLEQNTTTVASNIGTRLGSLSGAQGTSLQSRAVADSGAISGVAAGDSNDRYGVWLNPFFSSATQKARKGANGYKSTSGGASFGFDTKANDNMIIGAALTLMNTEVKHKDFKVGDKTKSDALMFSIYGVQQITDNWFAQGFATFGSNRVDNKESRNSAVSTKEIAKGKYSSMSFSGEAIAGYSYVMDQVVITPMGGLRFTRVNDGGYKETGTTSQNLDIKKKASNKFELVLGARVNGNAYDLGGFTVSPEVHAFINHDLVGKRQSVDVRLDGLSAPLPSSGAKPTKTLYNLGLGANAQYGMMEYGIGYDAHIANKYVGHQGSLKVRVNF